jgi:hypothetical protein
VTTSPFTTLALEVYGNTAEYLGCPSLRSTRVNFLDERDLFAATNPKKTWGILSRDLFYPFNELVLQLLQSFLRMDAIGASRGRIQDGSDLAKVRVLRLFNRSGYFIKCGRSPSCA